MTDGMMIKDIRKLMENNAMAADELYREALVDYCPGLLNPTMWIANQDDMRKTM